MMKVLHFENDWRVGDPTFVVCVGSPLATVVVAPWNIPHRNNIVGK
jgi:hypothetical protein